jgi:hypothetical protein
MMASRRWQDWGTVVLGVLLFLTSFLFITSSAYGATAGATADRGATWTAYVGGVLLVLAGAWNLAGPEQLIGEWAVVVVGVLLVISPWVVGFAGLMAMAWSAVVIGVLAVLLAASVLYAAGARPSRPSQAAQP